MLGQKNSQRTVQCASRVARHPLLAHYRYIWAKCDPDGDGKISRDELTPLLAAWKEVALQRTQQRMSIADEQEDKRAKQTSKTCTII